MDDASVALDATEEPLRRSLVLVSDNITNIGELISHLQGQFGFLAAPRVPYLSLDGFTLPPSQPLGILRDTDVVRVHLVGQQRDSAAVAAASARTDEQEMMVVTAPPLAQPMQPVKTEPQTHDNDNCQAERSIDRVPLPPPDAVAGKRPRDDEQVDATGAAVGESRHKRVRRRRTKKEDHGEAGVAAEAVVDETMPAAPPQHADGPADQQMGVEDQDGHGDGDGDEEGEGEALDEDLADGDEAKFDFRPINRPPKVGELIKYRVLELREGCPQVSAFKLARCVGIALDTRTIRLQSYYNNRKVEHTEDELLQVAVHTSRPRTSPRGGVKVSKKQTKEPADKPTKAAPAPPALPPPLPLYVLNRLAAAAGSASGGGGGVTDKPQQQQQQQEQQERRVVYDVIDADEEDSDESERERAAREKKRQREREKAEKDKRMASPPKTAPAAGGGGGEASTSSGETKVHHPLVGEIVAMPGQDIAKLVERKLDRTRAAVRRQVHYYFCDDNWYRDAFLRSQANDQGWVSLELVANFNRMKTLLPSKDLNFIRECLEGSSALELSSDGEAVRRIVDWDVEGSRDEHDEDQQVEASNDPAAKEDTVQPATQRGHQQAAATEGTAVVMADAAGLGEMESDGVLQNGHAGAVEDGVNGVPSPLMATQAHSTTSSLLALCEERRQKLERDRATAAG
ncbi:unnamed protein product [Vitrella brassicaformis CCMP3155]|uniref:HTH La-type RNA-binding domain-containing protein n=1 Tax=Vitrella brassicaformis (strain CCMP3155) TaxID=1169540 RepID=A0A0G4GQX0_VITBC|nr:unnamed protein product [Vitrella brassicaformis CCMP3155]|eukprot:CEM32845.1 unnamed protein product [Vitrella brassicaformis CCMP3155]